MVLVDAQGVKWDYLRLEDEAIFPLLSDFIPDINALSNHEKHKSPRAVALLKEAWDIAFLANGFNQLEIFFFERVLF